MRITNDQMRIMNYIGSVKPTPAQAHEDLSEDERTVLADLNRNAYVTVRDEGIIVLTTRGKDAITKAYFGR